MHQGRLSVIDEHDCRLLLASHRIGRVAWADPQGATVLPVTYLLDGERIVFRTRRGTVLAGLDGHPVTFEVDEIDLDTETGWSVLVRGTCHEVAQVPTGMPEPWAPGHHDLVMAVDADQVSGRSVSGAVPSS